MTDYSKRLVEVDEILKHLSQSDYDKIPEKIKDAIEKHMFPLSLLTKEKWPHYKESWIVILADKIDSFTNLPTPKEFLKYLGLTKRNRKKQ